MQTHDYQFDELNTLIDGVHSLFEQWNSARTFNPPLDEMALYQAQLALHEWIANLVQHATFSTGIPSVALQMVCKRDRVCYIIEDNSDGFDIDGRIAVGAERLSTLPEQGFGLLLLCACTQDLVYIRLDERRNRLAFTVSPDHEASLPISLFNLEDDDAFC